jgi:uncharacterized protein (TIGR02246 family)
MNSRMTQSPSTNRADEAAIRAIPQQMAEAWNQGHIETFAAPFTESAEFVEFEGTHLKGRQAIAEFHQQIYDKGAKGMRLKIEVKFVHFLDPQLAVMHTVAKAILPGQTEPSPSRDSMESFVVRKEDGEWRIEAFQNARKLTLERQFFLDDLDALPAEAQREVTNLVSSLKQSHQVEKSLVSR